MKVYLYGNCQMPALHAMMLEDYPDWSIDSWEVTICPVVGEAHLQQHFGHVRTADVVISQPLTDYKGNTALSLASLRDALPDRTQLVTMPSIVFEGTHGAFVYMGGRFPAFHMNYHNAHTIDMFVRGYHWDDICLLQASPAFYTEAFVLTGIEASLAELRSREERHQTTVRVAGLIDEHCRSAVLMNTINHPNRFLLARTLNAIYRAMGVPPIAKETGIDRLPNPHIPPLPTVLARLGIADEAPDIRADGIVYTREAYLRQTISYYARLVRTELMNAFAGSRGRMFVDAFHGTPASAHKAAPASRAPNDPAMMTETLVTEAFAALLKRKPSRLELERHGAAIHSLGLRHWFAALTSAEEFLTLYPPAGGNARD